jgi:hypothetical protein
MQVGMTSASGDCVREDVPVSTSGESILIIALASGIVVAIFGLIYVWEKWGKGTQLQQRIDRVSDMFDRQCRACGDRGVRSGHRWIYQRLERVPPSDQTAVRPLTPPRCSRRLGTAQGSI